MYDSIHLMVWNALRIVGLPPYRHSVCAWAIAFSSVLCSLSIIRDKP
jgi:hypothetical protein